MAVRWICEPSNPYDIRIAMKEIPTDLLGVYHNFFDRIERDRHQRRELAKRAINWVLGAQSQLSAQELILATSSGYEGYQANVTIEEVISSRHHLMIYNKTSDTTEFGHFSMVEFIRDQKKEFSQDKIHDLIAFLSLNAMNEEARVIDQHLRSSYVEKYVRTVVGSSIRSKHSNEIDQSNTKNKQFVSFWIYVVNLWGFHCQTPGADAGEPMMWSEPFISWSAIKTTKQSTRVISLTRNSGVSPGLNSIDHSVPEMLGQTFEKWLFSILYVSATPFPFIC
jgi:hypothetical protein